MAQRLRIKLAIALFGLASGAASAGLLIALRAETGDASVARFAETAPIRAG